LALSQAAKSCPGGARRSRLRFSTNNRTAAGAHAREVLQREPAFAVEAFLGTMHYRLQSDVEHLREGLFKAGLPG
jgi:hypothetical protein